MRNLFLESIRDEREYHHLLQNLRQNEKSRTPHPVLCAGLGENALGVFLPSLLGDLAEKDGQGILLVVPEEKEILKLSAILDEFGISSRSYPLRDFIFHNITASHEYEHERLGVLSGLLNGCGEVILTTPDALMQYTIPPALLQANSMTVCLGQTYEIPVLMRRLSDGGYVRCEMVDGAGQYSLRGGILDVFPPSMEHPVRMEFFGDEIDQMGIFDPMTQRKIEQIKECVITPAKEILLDSLSKELLQKIILTQRKKCKEEKALETLGAEIESLKAQTQSAFLDKYISVIYPTPTTLADYLEETTPVVVLSTEECEKRMESFDWHNRQSVESLLEEGTLAGKYAHYAGSGEDWQDFVSHRSTVLLNTFVGGTPMQLSGIYSFSAKQTVSYADNYALLLEDLKHYIDEKWRICILTPNEAAAKEVGALLFEEQIPLSSQVPRCVADILPGTAVISFGEHIGGYELPSTRFVVLSTYPNESAYTRALRSKTQKQRKKRSAAERITSYNDLNVGDFVVHEAHGIGQYLGIQNITSSDGTARDYIKIAYAGTDQLFIPCDQLDRISKYIGAKSESGTVRLSKMGGTEWKKTTAKAKAATKEMAKKLTKLYAERMRKQGFAFARDDDMQKDFEGAFEFEETEAQLTAAEEIKRDMEKVQPMDRLLCGDVGYGKTEVAIRAAFKAVLNGKQVALLVPTTLLALQHYQTMLARMRGFPVKVEYLSRFRTPIQQAEILRRLRRGEVDIIVGTHRLISADVQFRDLGLVIIDEEQRFGVAAKEKLKEIARNVDVLTLTATPIPRTLNMAMSGIRDMSILDEAPADRVPIQTFVLEYDANVLLDAVKKELRRGGQVFWLHNHVENISAAATMLQNALPEAVITTAHGKMDKEELNRIWQAMVNGEIDVLVSTTIIETGVDVPNANTLIIENADRMGLSQLHQIRGRVGRSGRRAYAYLTYPRYKVLTEIARKRLTAIKEFTEFGSGFKIAMRDLEIRGAGNILGAEQHGQMDSVGYDLYIKLLNEAILEERGETVTQKIDCVLNLSVDAFIPEKFISSPAQRIDIYKKIAAIENRADYDDIYDEVTDRFGEMPHPLENLLGISYLRALSSAAGLMKIQVSANRTYLYPKTLDFAVWSELSHQMEQRRRGQRITLMMGESPYLTYQCKGDLITQLMCLLEEYHEIADRQKEQTQEGNA